VTVLDQAPPLLGKTEPRLWTPPLRDLNPDTSYGFEVIDYAREILHRPLLPWQEFAVVHGGEMLDGADCSPALGAHSDACAARDPRDLTRLCRPRFRIVLLLVARQNGKTELPVILSIFWQFKQRLPLIVGTSTQLSYAKESWKKAVNLVGRTPALADQHAPARQWYRLQNNETESFTYDGSRYKIAAANEEGGRSLSVDRAIMDEIRQHKTYAAWDALEPACSPPDAQIWCLSNAGDSRSIVLNDHQDDAQVFIETGVGDDRMCLLEWSAPEDAEPDDVEALLQANPRVGYGADLEVLVKAGRKAKRLGGQALAGFKTERMCIRVKLLSAAIDPRRWAEALAPGELAEHRDRLAAVIELSPNGDHATLGVAAVVDGEDVRVETVAEWSGATAASQAERALPGLIGMIRPRVLGWFPTGPGAAIGAKLGAAGQPAWLPRGTGLAEIRAETPAVCMGFAKEIAGGTLLHSGQPMLDAQLAETEWQSLGQARVFARKNGNTDAVYAVAGAVHLARTLPVRLKVARRFQAAPG
jgi:hypothetical protein